MSHLQDWEQLYQQGRHISRWPWSDMVSIVKSHMPTTQPGAKVLELGSGAGANVPFFLAEGFDYTGVEGSPEAVKFLRKEFPSIADKFIVGDFTLSLPDGPFDLIVDRAALTHNGTAQIKACLEQVRRVLRPGGLFIGVDWFSTNNEEFKKGEAGIDPLTRKGFTKGAFAQIGQVHFFDRPHLEELFEGWEWVTMEEKISTRCIPAPEYVYASWSFVTRCPAQEI
jgi:SAM-dependent methyltransferase